MSKDTQTPDQIRERLRAIIATPIIRWTGSDDDPEVTGTVTKRSTQLDNSENEFVVLTIDDEPQQRTVEVACFYRLGDMVREYDPQQGDWVGIRFHGEEQSKNDKTVRHYTAGVFDPDGNEKPPVDSDADPGLKPEATGNGSEPGQAATEQAEPEQAKSEQEPVEEPF